MNDDHKDVLECYERFSQHDRHNIDEAMNDLGFVAGVGQWDERVRKMREARGQPCLTVNKLSQFVNNVAGDLMQSQPAIEIVGADDDQDPVYADIMGGLIRQIEYQSNSTSQYNWGAKCAITCGIGHWQIVTEYADDTTFDQDIRIKRIQNPLAVTWDDAAIELDRSDAMECFVSEMVSESVFKKMYKSEKLPSSFPEIGNGRASNMIWYDGEGKSVRIASHWRKVKVKKKIGITLDGKVIDLDDVHPSQWQQMGILKAREVDTYKVVHRKISGDGFLTDVQDWVGKHIPVVPVIGNEVSLDGRIIRSGIIRNAKDSQTLYNYSISAGAELVALQPKAPYLVPYASVEGLEAFWNKANTENLPYLPYNIIPEAPNARPQREAPPQGSAAIAQQVQIAENDMYGTTGIYPTSLGQRSNESSGKAIMAREKQTDTGTYVYYDNFKASIKRTGDILVDLTPRVYDSTRAVRILGADGQESMAKLNMISVNPLTGEESITNDLSAAKFDVRIKVGNSYASAREKALEAMTGLMTQNPNNMKVFGDLYFKAMDFPGASEIAARIKKTMPAELVGEGGMQPQQNPMQEIVQRLEVEGMAINNEKATAETQGKQIENMAKAHDLGVNAATAREPEPTAQSSAA